MVELVSPAILINVSIERLKRHEDSGHAVGETECINGDYISKDLREREEAVNKNVAYMYIVCM